MKRRFTGSTGLPRDSFWFNLNGAALHAALLLALHGVVGRVLVQFGEARKVEAVSISSIACSPIMR